jgi:uncharacterized repeat protein (TIGR01451 family)
MRTLLFVVIFVSAKSLFANSADLSLNTVTSAVYPNIYTNFSITATMTNNGPAVATNIVVQNMLPSGLVVMQGSNPGSVTAGSLGCLNTCWQIPALAPGQSASWTINLYALSTNAGLIKVFISAADQPDPDSDFGESGTPYDDDELIYGYRQEVPTATLPDLTVSAPGLPPGSLTSGLSYPLSITINNVGNAPAQLGQGGFYGVLYLTAATNTQAANALQSVPFYSTATVQPGGSVQVTAHMTLPVVASTTTYHLFAVVDASSAIAEDEETNNTSDLTSVVVSPPALPDLIVTQNNYQATMVAGQTHAATITVRNNGTVSSVAHTTEVYMSQSSNYVHVSTQLVATLSVSALAPGATQNRSFTLPVPANFAGTYYIHTRVDQNNEVAESNEANNNTAHALTVSPTVELPDLWVKPAAVVTPATIVNGGEVSMNFVTRNGGNAASSQSLTAVFLSSDPVWSADDNMLATRQVPISGDKTEVAHTLSAFLPVVSGVGTYYILFVADFHQTVAEVSENNTRSVAITIAALPPNLVAYDVYGYVGPQGITDSAYISIAGLYLGQKGVGPQSAALFYSTDGTLGANDIQLGLWQTDSLQPGAYIGLSRWVKFPAETQLSAPFWLIARFDSQHVLSESNETDNMATRHYFPVPVPSISSVGLGSGLAAFRVEPQTTFSVSSTIANNTYLRVAEWTYRYYLSTDGMWSASDIPISPLLTSQPTSVDYSNVALNDYLTIPANTPPGQYNLIHAVDPNNVWSNLAGVYTTTSFGPIEVGQFDEADLSITALTGTTSLVADQPYAYNVTVKNVGNLPSAAGTGVFGLSPDSLGGSFIQLGSFSVPARNAGQSTTITMNGTAPYNFDGDYYMQFRITPPATDLHLLNNTRSVRVSMVDPRPDLAILSVTATQSGSIITGQIQIRNEGLQTAPAASVDVSLVVSNDFTPYSAESYTQTVAQTPALAPQAIQIINFDYVLPVGYKSGAAGVKVQVNQTQDFVETNPVANNYKTILVSLETTQQPYDYYNFGAGVGQEIRKTVAGYQIIAHDGQAANPTYRIIHTNNSGNLIQSFVIGQSVAGFMGTDQTVSIAKTNATRLNLRKWTAAGTTSMNKNITVMAGAVPRHVMALNNGGFLVTGFIPVNNINQSWLLRLNASGGIVWQNVYPPTTGTNSGVASTGIRSIQTTNNKLYLEREEVTQISSQTSIKRLVHEVTLSNGNLAALLDVHDTTFPGNSTLSLVYSGKFVASGNNYLWAINATSSDFVTQTYSTTLRRRVAPQMFYQQVHQRSAYEISKLSAVQSFSTEALASVGKQGFMVSQDYKTLLTDISLVRLNSGGQVVWQRTGPGAMRDIMATPTGHYALTGVRNGQVCLVFIDANGDNFVPTPNMLVADNQTNEPAISEAPIQLGPVVPNPATTSAHLEVHSTLETDVHLGVISALGQQVYTFSDRLAPGHSHITLPVAHWPAGSYYIRMRTAAGFETTRIMLVHRTH